MKGVEEYFPEELNESEINNLVENALYTSRNEDKKKDSKKITKKQTKAISSILYKKINKKGDINMDDYPELDGINVKIGVQNLTKELIRNMMFNDKEVDDYQIDLTYTNLTKDNPHIKALSIEIS